MASDKQKYEFASTAWMNALRREIEGMLRNAPPDLRFSFCEVFTGVPKHLDRNGTGVLAWSCTIEGSRANFVEVELDNTDIKTVADYAYLIPLTHWRLNDGRQAEFNAYLEEGARDGKIKRSGDLSKFPAVLSGLHDAAVDFTE